MAHDSKKFHNNDRTRENIVVVERFISHGNDEESIMSAQNGDKSRFHRERKQKIARRQRIVELLNRAKMEQKSADASSRVKPRSVPA